VNKGEYNILKVISIERSQRHNQRTEWTTWTNNYRQNQSFVDFQTVSKQAWHLLRPSDV